MFYAYYVIIYLVKQNAGIMSELNQITETSKKTKTKKALKIILLLLFFGATFYTVYAVSKTLSGGSIASLEEIFSDVNVLYAVILALLVILLFFTDALKYAVVSKITTGKFRYRLAVSVGIMGRFYDNITPFNTGGQPYQVYQYYKQGYASSVATAIPIVKYIFQLIAWIFVSVILYIANSRALAYLPAGQAAAVGSLTYIGIVIASLAPAIVILFSLFPKTIHKFIVFFIRLGSKLKIVKDYEKVSNQTLAFLESYRMAFVYIAKNLWGVTALFVVSCMDFLLMMSVPFFVVIAFGKTEPSISLLFNVVTLNAYSLFAVSLVPTPGNSGAIEGVASMAFAPIPMANGALFWVVFAWRFCTYYIYIIFGLTGTLIKFCKKRNRNRLIKKYKLNG